MRYHEPMSANKSVSTEELLQLEKQLEKLVAECDAMRGKLMKYGVSTMAQASSKLVRVRGLIGARALERGGPELTPAQVVHAARVALDKTQAEFAAMLGVATNSVARWERGEMRVRPATLKLVRMLAAAAPTRKTE
jgi:DNA-binding transcriptional regulator YiaG